MHSAVVVAGLDVGGPAGLDGRGDLLLFGEPVVQLAKDQAAPLADPVQPGPPGLARLDAGARRIEDPEDPPQRCAE